MHVRLHTLGCEFAWVVHGSDGLDEITTTGETRVVELDNGQITEFTLQPSDAGLPQAVIEDLIGGTPQENAAALRALLDGQPSAYRGIVVMNAAAALIVAGLASNLKDGAQMAVAAIDGGAAKATLETMAQISRGEA